MNRNEYKATPVEDLKMPTQSTLNNGPVGKTKAMQLHDDCFGTEPKSTTTTENTGFKRGIPGCDNC